MEVELEAKCFMSEVREHTAPDLERKFGALEKELFERIANNCNGVAGSGNQILGGSGGNGFWGKFWVDLGDPKSGGTGFWGKFRVDGFQTVMNFFRTWSQHRKILLLLVCRSTRTEKAGNSRTNLT